MGWMILLSCLLTITVAPFAIRFTVDGAKKAKRKAAEVSSMLGLKLMEVSPKLTAFAPSAGFDGGVETAHASEWQIAEAKRQAIEQLPKALSGLAGLIVATFPWHLAGEYQKVPVRILRVNRGGGKQKRSYTRYEAALSAPLPFSLTVTKEGVLVPVGKALFGTQDIETGDEELDRLVRVQSDKPEQARLWLSSVGRKQALLRLYNDQPKCRLESNCLSLETPGFDPDFEQYRSILEVLTKAVKDLR